MFKQHKWLHSVLFSVCLYFTYNLVNRDMESYETSLEIKGATNLGDLIETRESQIQELGVRAGKVFLWGRLGLRFDAGIYAIQPMHTEKPWFYNAIGWEYRIRDNWLFRNRLKSHLNKADYMEWGIQYLW